MTCAELYELMENPSKLSDKSLSELKQIVSDFPYFHVARMLYLKNLAMLDDIRLDVELKRMAIHIPDRMKLFLLLDNDEQNIHASDTVKKDDKFSIIENFLLSNKNDENINELQYEFPLSADYTYKLFAEEKVPDNLKEQMPYQELIDALAENNGIRSHVAVFADDDDMNDDFDASNKITISNDNYFTETLARIYIRQRRYTKALEIIKQLNLKYPEKNIYFADQIRFLEKLIIHTKKK